MSKYIKRIMGSYKAVDKLIAVELDELNGKYVPTCDQIVVEIKRGDRALRSKKIPVIEGFTFP
jgi:hypothetical protein